MKRSRRIHYRIVTRRNRRIHNVLVIKLTIFTGLLAAFFIPEGHKELALFAINNLWLWRS